MAPVGPGRARGRWQLVLLVLAFALPMLIAIGLKVTGWRAERTQNYGTLLEPPVDLAGVRARTDADATVSWRNTENRWLLLARVPERCDDPCWDELARLPRLRLALGRHAPRLELMLLERAPPPERRAGLAPMRYAVLEPPAPDAIAHDPERGPAIWLVDPHGFLVLEYAPGYDLDRVIKDLKKLIR